MQRYAAFLRGVSPMNCKMPALATAFESAGFSRVKTLLSSGNVVFGARKAAVATLQRQCEAAMQDHLGKSFMTFVRPIEELAALIERDPFKAHRVPANAKRVITFLHETPQHPPALPIERDGARIVAIHGREAFCAYVPQPGNPVFMVLIDRHFGKAATTRTWDTLAKVVKAGQAL
jgi:uncharacterized protein (DUF1697 family)